MNDFITINQIVRILRRRWWIILLAVLLAVLAAYLFSMKQTRIYRATGSLMVGPTITAGDPDRYVLQVSEQLAATYADIAQRQRILQAVVAELQLNQSWRTLRDQVGVAPVAGTQLLEIRAEAPSREQAVAIADEVARQLMLLIPASSGDQPGDETEQFVQQRLERLQESISSGQLRIDSLEEHLGNLIERSASAEQLQQVQDEISALDNLLTTWEANYASLYQTVRSQSPAKSLSVFEPAEAANNPVSPRTKLNLMIAAILGFGIGLALIVLQEMTDDSLRSADEITDVLHLPSLGAVSRQPNKQAEALLLTNQDAFSPIAEDVRLLRSKVLAVSNEWPRRVLLVTSPAQGEGKSLLVANLGIALANIGLRTAIVDANLRRPTQHLLFHLPQADGLTEEIHSSASELTQRVKPTQVQNLFVMTSGSLRLASPDRLATARMTELLDQLAQQVDIILCDAPEAVGISDTLVLANQAGGVLLVVDAGETRREAARQAVANLHQSGAELLGFVLNRASAPAHSAGLKLRGPLSNVMGDTGVEEPTPSKL